MEVYKPAIRKVTRVPKAPRIKLDENCWPGISTGLVGSGVGVSGMIVRVGEAVIVAEMLGWGVSG